MNQLPKRTEWVIVGAGFAGIATAWALGRNGLGGGILIERESTYGTRSSGRNAGLLRLVEHDPIVADLACRSCRLLAGFNAQQPTLFHATGGLTIASRRGDLRLEELFRAGCGRGIPAALLTGAAARARFPVLAHVEADTVLWCSAEGVIDVHALMTTLLRSAQANGFSLVTNREVTDLETSGARVTGVRIGHVEVGAQGVIDASGAWAGRLGRQTRPLPLQPLKRHLFVTNAPVPFRAGWPYVWTVGGDLYFRSEGEGLLTSPCDETLAGADDWGTDFGAAALLADRLAHHAPALADLAVRRSWACLRTFAPDRRPLIGPDPEIAGLFHVSGLGGFGVTAAAAVGDLAATLLAGCRPDWIDPSPFRPGRFARVDL